MDCRDAAGGGGRAWRDGAVAATPHHAAHDRRDFEAGSVNTILHAPRPSSRSRGVVRPSPDMLYSICVYDLSAAGGAVRVSTHDMPETYWSVSLFDFDTNNFYALNDRQAKAGTADFLLALPRAPIGSAGLPVVVPPTDRGIVLFRTLINDERRMTEIDAKRQFAACGPYSGAGR
jgi:uncharacterized membrane protein